MASVTAQTTFTVTNTDDSGAGSLRQAIADANNNPGADDIHFDISGGGPHVIQPTSALPAISDPVNIDGFTQNGASLNTNPITEPSNAVLQIVLDGVNTGSLIAGLHVTGDGTTIQGLNIQQFSGDGILIESDDNTIVGNYIGTDVNGAADRGNGLAGVRILFGSNNVFGGMDAEDRNVFSGNTWSGLQFFGETSTDNVVIGNFIGLDATGNTAIPNDFEGVVFDKAPDNWVGGETLAERNVISGNVLDGVNQFDPLASGNVIIGNFIGTDRTGTVAVPNERNGVRADNAPGGTIGGLAPSQRNLISGNLQHGIALYNDSQGWTIQGNFIGTDSSGTAAVGNQSHGIQIQTENITVGGVDPSARNIISGNEGDGIEIGRDENTILGNYIGTDITGTISLGNGTGVDIEGGDDNTIGGSAQGARNIISGNAGRGLRIQEEGDRNVVLGNFIGVDATGSSGLPNGGDGVEIEDSEENIIGGTSASEGNVISANSGNGIEIFGVTAVDNVIIGNLIGTDVAGTASLGNGFDGIRVEAPGNTIGGTSTGSGNVISGNADDGIHIEDSENTVIQGNFIGTDVSGSLVLGNGNRGVNLEGSGSNNNTVGGSDEGAANTIAFNAIGIVVSQGNGNVLHRNRVFSNTNLGIDLAEDGVSANDAGDADSGPNNLQNYPEIATATGDNGAILTIEYSVPSATSNSTYPLTIDFFLADVDQEEGRTFIGSHSYSAGNAELQVNAAFTPSDPVLDGDMIVATATDANGNTSEYSSMVAVSGTAVSNEPGPGEHPGNWALYTAYPNPFNPQAVVPFEVAETGPVRLAVYDLLGRHVSVLVDGTVPAGIHEAVFDARGLASGMYVIRMSTADGFAQSRHVMLLR